jgi:hypothetical protein
MATLQYYVSPKDTILYDPNTIPAGSRGNVQIDSGLVVWIDTWCCWTEERNHILSNHIYIPHEPNVTVAFKTVFLIYAKSIDPEYQDFFDAPKVCQGDMQI